MSLNASSHGQRGHGTHYRGLLLCYLYLTLIFIATSHKHCAFITTLKVVLTISEKYTNGRNYQLDMNLPRSRSTAGATDAEGAVRDRSRLWPEGIIPYVISYNLGMFRRYWLSFVFIYMVVIAQSENWIKKNLVWNVASVYCFSFDQSSIYTI